jgi:hypothetical protein
MKRGACASDFAPAATPRASPAPSSRAAGVGGARGDGAQHVRRCCSGFPSSSGDGAQVPESAVGAACDDLQPVTAVTGCSHGPPLRSRIVSRRVGSAESAELKAEGERGRGRAPVGARGQGLMAKIAERREGGRKGWSLSRLASKRPPRRLRFEYQPEIRGRRFQSPGASEPESGPRCRGPRPGLAHRWKRIKWRQKGFKKA